MKEPPERIEATPPAAPLVGEVIAIGDELTTGQRLDTNTRWLSQRLTEQGVEVRYHTTVADDLDANIAVFRAAAERADVVVSTGGLGPTADDLTRDAMAAAAGVELLMDSQLAAHIEQIFTSRGRQMPPQNRRQAQLPAGARAIDNPGGTAPGVDQTIGRCRLFALPGVPAEMREMWSATVAPAVASRGGPRRLVRHWLVKCFGAGESHVESLLPDLIARGREPLVGITASHATITLRVTASGADEAACHAAMAPTLEEVRTTLGDLIFAEQPGAEDETTLEQAVIRQLGEMGARLATFEGMTRGLLGSMVGDADPAGHVVQRTKYSAIDRRVDDPVELVASMARRQADRLGYAVVVGPLVEGNRVPVAAATPLDMSAKLITLVGHPSIHRPLAAKHALNLLRIELLKDR